MCLGRHVQQQNVQAMVMEYEPVKKGRRKLLRCARKELEAKLGWGRGGRGIWRQLAAPKKYQAGPRVGPARVLLPRDCGLLSAATHPEREKKSQLI